MEDKVMTSEVAMYKAKIAELEEQMAAMKLATNVKSETSAAEGGAGIKSSGRNRQPTGSLDVTAIKGPELKALNPRDIIE